MYPPVALLLWVEDAQPSDWLGCPISLAKREAFAKAGLLALLIVFQSHELKLVFLFLIYATQALTTT